MVWGGVDQRRIPYCAVMKTLASLPLIYVSETARVSCIVIAKRDRLALDCRSSTLSFHVHACLVFVLILSFPKHLCPAIANPYNHKDALD